MTAFAALPRHVQGKVTDFVNKFRNDPTSPGINYEKINGATDKKMCSVRIDDTYRGIVVRQQETGVYLLLWVDHHDEAYDWARRKKCEVNAATGNVQVFDIQHANDEVQPIAPEFCLFAEYSDEQLLKIGVPEEQLTFVKNIPHLTAFYASKDQLPEDAYENLEWLANANIEIQQMNDEILAYSFDKGVRPALERLLSWSYESSEGYQYSFIVNKQYINFPGKEDIACFEPTYAIEDFYKNMLRSLGKESVICKTILNFLLSHNYLYSYDEKCCINLFPEKYAL